MARDESDKTRSTFTSEVLPTEGRPGFEDTVVTTTTVTTDPVAVASELVGSFKGMTDEMKELKKVPGRVRNLRILMVLVVLSLLGLAGTVYALRQVQISICESTNDVRVGSLHIADAVEASLAAPEERVRTEAEIARTEAFIDGLREDFKLRDC